MLKKMRVNYIKRPKKISTGKSKTIEAIKHLAKFLRLKKNIIPDYIIILQPTSPLRQPKHINNAIQQIKNSKKADSLVSCIKVKHNFTNPNPQNPIMNVILPEIQDNPDRLQAAPAYNKAVENEINESVKTVVKNNFNDENIDEKLFSDLGDNFNFEQSMRQFHATASTTVPNNQKEFAQFCYGNMSSCKDGDVEKCVQANYRHINM